ncbi:MAG: glycosyltransferase family 4 protein [Anaerolineae bacterium]
MGLDATLLALSEDYRDTGIARYSWNLLKHLPDGADGHRYSAYTGEPRLGELSSRLTVHRNRVPTTHPLVRAVWGQTLLPLYLARDGVDLLHGLGFVLPLLDRRPSVLTIYDLGFLIHPHLYKPSRRAYLGAMVRLSAHRATRFIAISQHTRSDLVRELGVSEDRIDVLPCAADEALRPVTDSVALEAFRQRAGLPSTMILYLGTVEPRKNLETLLEAYRHLLDRAKAPPLVVAGAKGWGWQRIHRKAEALGLEHDVVFPGFVPREELSLWYSACDVFVYPSRHEGFGIPPLEAMACGAPVIAADASSLPEVVADAGLLFPPDDPRALADALSMILQDGSLRESLSSRGRERSRLYRWSEIARQTLAVYERAMADASDPGAENVRAG